MPYLGKQAEEGGALITAYEFLQGTDTASSTTSFSISSSGGDVVRVYLNGVLLLLGGSNDYTVTASAVVFGSAPADGDIVHIDVYEAIALSDAVKSSGGTFSGAVTFSAGAVGNLTGNASGTAATVTTAAQPAITSVGTLTGLTVASPVINTGISGSAVKDEDNMSSNSATHVATQQSIKAYSDGAASQATTAAQGVGTGDSPTFSSLTLSADLTVNGTTVTLNTQTVEVEDNILQLNTTQASPDTATAATSGISVYRGNGVTQASLIFDDADDAWDITNDLVVAGDLETSTTGKIIQRGEAFMKTLHNSWVMGG